MISKRKRIAVLMGGQSSEREISLRTGQAILKALQDRGYRAFPIDAGSDIAFRLREGKVDIAFIALHGRLGEDGTIQGLLEVMGIPYTGSGVMASALSMNKVMSKKVFDFHKIPTPEFQYGDVAALKGEKIDECCAIGFPMVVKPVEEGSTIGITIVRKKRELAGAVKKASAFGDTVLFERFIRGREVTVGVLDGRPLPIIEIAPREGFYDYHAKYTKGFTEYILPARLKKTSYARVQEFGVKAYQALGCEGVARVDFMVDEEERPYCLEVNTVPGMTETSLLPKAAKAVGIDFNELVETILAGARLRTD
ncbi:MAG: D-alanine--D-alanine ligase [Proteobacteria bacterium]|nr:D-alanine--D-alanine ligase [Pseudomonadota bacterium]